MVMCMPANLGAAEPRVTNRHPIVFCERLRQRHWRHVFVNVGVNDGAGPAAAACRT
jgi:hypothetical protein